MKSYASNRPGTNLACFLVVFGIDRWTRDCPARHRLSARRGTVVVTFIEVLGEIEDEDPGPSVRVHGDGCVTVHYPRYMETTLCN